MKSEVGKLLVYDRITGQIIDEVTKYNGLISCVYTRKVEEEGKEDMYIDFEIEYGATSGIEVGNKLVIEDEEGKHREFLVEDYEEVDGEVIVGNSLPTYLTDIGKGKPVKTGKEYKNTTSKQLVEEYIKGTGWKLSSIPNFKNKNIEVEKAIDPLSLLEEYALESNMVLDFYVEVGIGKVNSRLLEVRSRQAIYTGKEIIRGKDLNSLVLRETSRDVITALLVEYTTRKTVGDEEVETINTLEVYDNNANVKVNKEGVYNWGVLESGAETKEEARAEGLKHLEESAQLTSSFEVDVEDLSDFLPHERVRFGDRVYIKDKSVEPPILLGGEVVGVTYDISDSSTKKYTVGGFVKLYTRQDSLEDRQKNTNKKVNKNTKEIAENRKLIKKVVSGGNEVEEGGEQTERALNNSVLNNDAVRTSLHQNIAEYDDSNMAAGEVNYTTADVGDYSYLRVESYIPTYGVYTLQFDATFDKDTNFSLNIPDVLHVVSLMVNWRYTEYKKSAMGGSFSSYQEPYNVNVTAGETLRIRLTFLEDTKPGPFERVRRWFYLMTNTGGLGVRIKNLSIFEGTALYSKSELGIVAIEEGRTNKIPDGVFEDKYSSDRGFRFYREFTGVSLGRVYEGNPLVNIRTPGNRNPDEIMRLTFRVKFEERILGHFGFQNLAKEIYKEGTPNDAGISVRSYTKALDIVSLKVINRADEVVANVKPFERVNVNEEGVEHEWGAPTYLNELNVGEEGDYTYATVEVLYRDLDGSGINIGVGITQVASPIPIIDFHAIDFEVTNIKVNKGKAPGMKLDEVVEEQNWKSTEHYWKYTLNKELREKDRLILGLEERLTKLEENQP